MKRLKAKKMRLIICAFILIPIVYIIITSFAYASNLGYFIGDIFIGVDTPTHETYISAFTENQINWEIAYWSAMISEYTYAKESYPRENFALTTLGFTTARFYSFFELDGEDKDDLMVDVGIKEISSDIPFTLVVFAFRGSVPLALNSPTTGENMRRNMDVFSHPWRESEFTVHRGFYNQYNDFVTHILPDINEKFNLDILQSNSTVNQHMKIWITGHSMGGALAELFTLDLVKNGVQPERIMTYGFATPLVANQSLREHAEAIGASNQIFRIVHRQDMVSYVGYGIIRGASLAADNNAIIFGSRGIFNRSHHSLPRIYIPFIVSQNDQSQRQQMETSLIIEDI